MLKQINLYPYVFCKVIDILLKNKIEKSAKIELTWLE